jgi:hypothetical protein
MEYVSFYTHATKSMERGSFGGKTKEWKLRRSNLCIFDIINALVTGQRLKNTALTRHRVLITAGNFPPKISATCFKQDTQIAAMRN